MLRLPGPGHVSSIAENLIMTAISSSPPLRTDPLGCHIRVYIREIPQKETKPMRTPPHDLISPTTDQFPMSSLSADLVHGETPPPAVGGKNPCRRHLYRPEIHKMISKVKPLQKTSNPTPPSPIIVEAPSDALGETRRPIPAHSRNSPPVPSYSVHNCNPPIVRDNGASRSVA